MKKLLTAKNILILAGIVLAIGLLINYKHNKMSTVPANLNQIETDQNPTSSAGLANPASENCAKQGGTTQIKDGPNGQYGLCDFGDNMACEEWALFRGECPVGGIKTTGYDTIDQKYCAWVGGKTIAEEDATCTLPSGKVCSDSTLYAGTCSPN